jgi:hypothetical protein
MKNQEFENEKNKIDHLIDIANSVDRQNEYTRKMLRINSSIDESIDQNLKENLSQEEIIKRALSKRHKFKEDVVETKIEESIEKPIEKILESVENNEEWEFVIQRDSNKLISKIIAKKII